LIACPLCLWRVCGGKKWAGFVEKVDDRIHFLDSNVDAVVDGSFPT